MRFSRGGYSGLNPVYAAVTDQYLYKNSSTLDYGTLPDGATQIKDLYLEGALTVNQIGTNAIASTAITTKVINATDSFMINGKQFSIDSATTLTGGGTLNISEANAVITAYNSTGDDALVKKSYVDTAISGKASQDDVDKLKAKTTNISYTAGTGTTVDGVTINNGAVTGVKSINDKKVVFEDGTVYINKDADKNQIKIGTDGKVIIGKTSSAYDEDGFYAGGHSYDEAKAAIGSDGSLKAADGKFVVDSTSGKATFGDATNKVEIENGAITATGDATVGGNLNVTGTSTFTGETTFSGGIKTDKISETTTGAGVTVNGNKITTDNKFNDVTLKDGNVEATDITATGALKGQTLGVGSGASEFAIDANGNITKATSITADENKLSTIGGVKLQGKKVTADTVEVNDKITTKDLDVTGHFSVGDFETNNLTVNTKLTVGAKTTLEDGTLILGTDANHTLTKDKLKTINETINNTGEINTSKATIGTNTIVDSTGINTNSITSTAGTIGGITLSSNEISGVNTINAKEFKVNSNNYLNETGITATKGVIGGVTLEGKEVKADKFTSGASSLANGNLIIDAQNSWTSAGIIAKSATITDTATIGGNTTISSTGIETNKVTMGDMTLTDGNITDANGVTINGVELKTNAVTASGGFTVDANNKLDNTGLTAKAGTFADSVTVGSSADSQTKIEHGKITVTGVDGRSNADGKVTTIDGGIITTDTLNVQRIELGEKLVDSTTGETITDSTIYLNHDGSFGAAKGAFQIDKDGQVTNKIDVTGADASETIFSTSKTGINAKYRKGTGAETSGLTIEDNHAALNASGGAALDLKDKTAKLGIGTDSLTTYTEDTIESKVGTDVTRTMTTKTTKSIKDKVGEASREITENSIVDSVAGKTITTDTKGTKFGITGSTDNTLINGSTITSTKGSATGVLDGSTLTLTNGSAKTTLNAGSVTFESDNAGVYNGKKTTIDGGVISTDTLNVKRINLGGDIIDEAHADPTNPASTNNSTLYMDDEGNFRAATGNFTVKGGNGTDRGAMHNAVGNTTFDTTETSASMKYTNATETNKTSEVSVADNSAKMSTGTDASVSTSDGKVEIKGGTQTVTTTSNGTVFENTAHKDPFGGGSETKTTINGNEITTGKITTDQLVIKGNGQGAAGGTTSGGSIALAGDGSLKSDINDGTNHTTFETTKTGTTTTVEDGTYTAKNEVKANKIGSVITGGTVEISQELNAETGKITNAAGATSTELSNDGFAVKQNGYTDVNIAKGDVSVTNTQTGKQVNLSDLGSLGDLNEEITSREEYTSNKTAVGAINAEAGIRREEVARLDGRINDVNDRVNKVGAMAAAIASLKSIGYDPQAPSEFSIGLGQYKGETGVAMGFFHYPNKNFMINVSLSTAGGETMGGIGATWRFGHKSPQKLLDEQREAQAKKELAAAEKYKVAAQLAKEAQERAEYAAKLARQAQVSADNAKAAADATQAKHF